MNEKELKENYPLFYKVIFQQIKPVSISFNDDGISLLFSDGREKRNYFRFEISLMEQGLKSLNEKQ